MKYPIFVLLALGVLVTAVFKFASFRHVGESDPTVSLYLGEWMVDGNAIGGALPKSSDAYTLLLQGIAGFPGEALYSEWMYNAWVVMIILGLGATLAIAPKKG
ncbi:MAG: hypothetical protein AAF293_08645 [Pseudomonadota bacterium]